MIAAVSWGLMPPSMATISLTQRIIVEQVRRSLLSLSPAERLVLYARFGLGDTTGLAGERRMQSLGPRAREGIEKLALRRLRRLSGAAVELRDEPQRRQPATQDRPRPPRWPGVEADESRIPPRNWVPRGPGDEPGENLWDEA